MLGSALLGPALLVHNNAQFSEADFQSIQVCSWLVLFVLWVELCTHVINVDSGLAIRLRKTTPKGGKLVDSVSALIQVQNIASRCKMRTNSDLR